MRVNIMIADVYNNLLEETERRIVWFRDDGKVFEGALFFPLEADDMITNVVESAHINADVYDVILAGYRMLEKYDMKAKDDKTLTCMLHWQHVNGFSDEMFFDIYKAKTDTEYLAMEREVPEKVKPSMEERFNIANISGKYAIKKVYDEVFEERKSNIEKMTKFVIFLNHTCWDFYGDYPTLSAIYSDLYYKAHDYVLNNFDGEDIKYYLRMTD